MKLKYAKHLSLNINVLRKSGNEMLYMCIPYSRKLGASSESEADFVSTKNSEDLSFMPETHLNLLCSLRINFFYSCFVNETRCVLLPSRYARRAHEHNELLDLCLL